MDAARRRLAALAGHVLPGEPSPSTPATRHAAPTPSPAAATSDPCSRGGGSGGGAAAAGGFAPPPGPPGSSYARIHGPVSTAPPTWTPVPALHGRPLADILYDKALAPGDGIARLTINRPHVRNAFRPETVAELAAALGDARDDGRIATIILTGAGTEAFCSGGDQGARGKAGYVGPDGVPRLNVLDLQVQIRRTPKPVVAMVAGYAVGGGHVLQVCCDLAVAADNAVFGQTGPRVGSFDAGYGASALARLVGQRRAREVWFLARLYSAEEAAGMGLVNAVVPLADLEGTTVAWCREMGRNSPTALRVMKAALNAVDDGGAGLQELGGNATLLFYQTEEGSEGKNSFLEKRPPDFSRFPRLP